MIDIVDMQLAITRLFGGYRTNLFIPNVSWGIGLRHECDMVIAHKTKYMTEIEIKRSASDIKADLSKKTSHWEAPIRKVYFAVPEELAGNKYIPEYAGIIKVSNVFRAEIIRTAKLNPKARKLSDREYLHLLELGCMRIWNLKAKIRNIQKRTVK